MTQVTYTDDGFTFTLLDSRGAEHRYECSLLHPYDAADLAATVLDMGGEPLAELIEGPLTQAIVPLIDEVLLGASEADAEADSDKARAGLITSALTALKGAAGGLRFSTSVKKLTAAVMNLNLVAIAQVVLQTAKRDGTQLGTREADACFGRNYGELREAIWTIFMANELWSFFGTSSTSVESSNESSVEDDPESPEETSAATPASTGGRFVKVKPT